MRRSKRTLSLLFTVAFACASHALGQTLEGRAPLFEDLGEHHHAISTRVPLAQRYFDQGLILAYAFNHAEAERSFREAARLDPDCAMCYWGAALVLGPNINAPMEQDDVSKAWKALQAAIERSNKASEKEKAYIQALAKRYSEKALDDRSPLDLDYAEVMRELVQRYPDDLDAAALFAEALMDLHPWDYWTKEGQTQPWTPEILTVLKSVLARHENHPGANHLYIHAVEASPNPERGLASADRLHDLVPGAGHLVHMPAHIYVRLGRYHDASLANQRAIAADDSYLEQVRAQGIYPLAYVPHNHHFLWATATMEGRNRLAIGSARETASRVDRESMREPGMGALQHYHSMPVYALARFGKWEAILREPAPEADLRYPTGVWHYARGLAFAATRRPKEAEQELDKLKAIAKGPLLAEVKIWDLNSTQSVLQIAVEVLAGELAAKQGNYETAIGHLETAVTLEDGLKYSEPSDWYYPVRQSLGAVLLEAGHAAKAERVYREDLQRNPENGWSLFGLARSLRAQAKTEEVLEVERRFKKAWSRADVVLTSSRF